jgi:hypothetical protein
MAKLRTLIFFGFFWIGLKTKMNCGDGFVDAHQVNRGNLIPRWYGVARSSCERRDDNDGSGWMLGINWCYRWTLLAWTLMPIQHPSNPVGYSRLHTLAHVAVDHETVVCNLLIPSGMIDHTKLVAVSHQIQMSWCGGVQMKAYSSSTKYL